MNKTEIEWCDMTWNPVTGCNHGCEYCYARGIAKRFGKKLPDRSGYCIFCGEVITGQGHNPEPVKDRGVCCEKCNNKIVVPARLRMMKEDNRK